MVVNPDEPEWPAPKPMTAQELETLDGLADALADNVNRDLCRRIVAVMQPGSPMCPLRERAESSA